jgi:hypothetical protein
MELDPGIHIVIHSVLSLNTGCDIEGVSEIDSEHGDPVISPHHSSSGSQSSVGNFDDF